MEPHQPVNSSSQLHDVNDDAERIHRRQQKERLENSVRLKRGEITDRQRRLHDIERESDIIEKNMHRIQLEHDRVDQEVKRMQKEAQQGVTVEKQSEVNMRDTAQDMIRKNDTISKLEHDIRQLKKQIAGKEHEMADIKEEMRDLMRVKEDSRRTGELEHFNVKTQVEHIHDKEVKVTLMGQEILRYQNQLDHYKQQYHEIKEDINIRQQDLSLLEVELQKVQH